MRRVVELAVEDAQREGWDLDVAAVDDEADDTIAAEVAHRLCSEEAVIAVVGHKNSGPSRAGAPIYAAAGLAQLTQCSTDDSLSRSGWDTFFRLCADNERQAEVAAHYAHSHLKPARVAVVHDGTHYGRPLVEAFVKRMKALDTPPVRVLAMQVGQRDFSRAVESIREAHAQLVYIGATEIEGSKLTIALREAGVDAQIMTSEGGPDNPFARLAGDAAEGTIHTYAGADPSATEASRRIAQRCVTELGAAPTFMVECCDAVTAIVAALATGATTRAQMRDAVAQVDVEGLAGRIRFTSNGDRVNAPVSLWRVERSRMVPVDETAVP